MNWRWLANVLLLVAVNLLPAQQAETNRATFQQTKNKAEKGDAEAQCLLGWCYDFGNDVAENKAEAAKWYRKAAEQGQIVAQYALGACYENGNGVPKDDAEAVRWYRKAAEQGLAGAQCNLGVCYDNGTGVPKDEVEAFRWYRKAAEQGLAYGQNNLGFCYDNGTGVPKDEVEAFTWYRKAAEQGYAVAQFNIGNCYANGNGVPKDAIVATKWFRKAADQGDAKAQYNLGVCYDNGHGVSKDAVESVKWYRKAAEQGLAEAQNSLGWCYANGQGVPKDFSEAYKWANLASAQGVQAAKTTLAWLELRMTPDQISEGQRLSREFQPLRLSKTSEATLGSESVPRSRPAGSGTGFFITEDGFLITNEHVVKEATQAIVVTGAGTITARVVKVDAANDLALLKADGRFEPLAVASSRSVRLGNSVATIGFPNVGLQGFSPKLAKGEIASLSGAQDDPRYFQISVPVQPGNSGGALVDERGNVVGVVAAKLDAATTLLTSGSLPENVNYAVKSSFLLGFLESVPEVSAKLKDANSKERKFEDVVRSAEQAAVLVLVY